jgi:hypothetical protein
MDEGLLEKVVPDTILSDCSHCGGKSKPFYVSRKTGRRLGSWCKECHRSAKKHCYPRDRVRAVAYSRRYWAEHRDELCAKRRLRYLHNRDEERAKFREARLEDPEKYNQRGRDWRQRNRESYNERAKTRQREQRHRLKEEMFTAYGRRCWCCGETTEEFLSLDHLNDDGAEHRGRVGGTMCVLRDLRRRGWPKEGYAVACMNCNWARRYGGTCPHQLRKGAVNG